MFNSLVSSFIFFLNYVNGYSDGYSCPHLNISVEESFKTNNIFKDLDLDKTQQSDKLKFIPIHYSRQVDCGNNFTIEETLFPPEVEINITSSPFDESLFSFIMIGPVKPIPTTKLSILHWLITNIPGNHLKNGTTFASYLSPTPIAFQGPYRYDFMVYRQSRYLKIEPEEIIRNLFAVTPWAIKMD